MILVIIIILFSNANAILNFITLTNTNHISITGTINQKTVSKFIADIKMIQMQKIYIYINSDGGEVLPGEQIIQYMNYTKYQNHSLYCIAEQALSTAFHIFQHCDERLILPNSILMQHQMKLEIEDTLDNINNYIKIYNNINNNHILFESKKFGMTQEQYRIKTLSEWWIYSIDAIIFNVADKIVNSIGCDIQLTKSIKIIIESGILTKKSLCPLI